MKELWAARLLSLDWWAHGRFGPELRKRGATRLRGALGPESDATLTLTCYATTIRVHTGNGPAPGVQLRDMMSLYNSAR